MESHLPRIILKLDDLCCVAGGLHPGWVQLFDFLDEQGLPASLGLICESLEHAPQSFLSRVRALADSGRYEIWNHGWSHMEDKARGVREFYGTGYDYQRDAVAKSQALAREALGLTMRGFGAPFNAADDDTARVVAEHADIQWWFYHTTEVKALPGITLLPREPVVHLEQPVHVPNPAALEAGFTQHRDAPMLVLQGHPQSWTVGDRFAGFQSVVRHLKDAGCTFVLPSAYLSDVLSSA